MGLLFVLLSLSAAAARAQARIPAPPKVVVVGAGFGGLEAALRLSREDAEVIVIDRENHHVFQPLLYQVASGELSPAQIAQPIRRLLSGRSNVRVVMGEARSVDLERKTVALDGHELSYDKLILAAGVRSNYFGRPDWAENAPSLKAIDDAVEIRRRVLSAFEAAEQELDEARRRELLTFVVVGGGPTGVELAGSLKELAVSLRREFRSIDPARARVVLLEGGPRILPFLDEKLGAAARKALSRRGVEVHTGAQVCEVSASSAKTKTESFRAATVLWASGVEASPLSRTLGVELDVAGRVKVEPDLSIPGHPDAFVVGDLAALIQDGRQLPGLARPAIRMGRHAAENVARSLRGLTPKNFRFNDPGIVAVIARHAAVGSIGGLRIAGLVAWLAWLAIHLAFLKGWRSRVAVAIEWLWSYVTRRKGARLITGKR